MDTIPLSWTGSVLVAVPSQINARFVDAGAWPLAWLLIMMVDALMSTVSCSWSDHIFKSRSSGRPKLPGSDSWFNWPFLLRQAVSAD